MQQQLPWILASLSLALLVGAALLWAVREREPRAKPLPTEWTLGPRPVFSSEERRVYRQLREALPHHIVLSKLPLVRFCQPIDPNEVRYWYELLGSNHVSFAICSANGRVLAAIDLEAERGGSRRSVQIKRAVLAACKVRYLRCLPEELPSVPELQLLVPQIGPASRGPQAAPAMGAARAPLVGSATDKRRARPMLWADSGFLQDSFFGPDGRIDSGGPSGFGALQSGAMAPLSSSPGVTVREFSGLPEDAAGLPGAEPRPRPPLRH